MKEDLLVGTKLSEEEKMYLIDESEDFVRSYNKVPYQLIREELDVEDPTDYNQEIGEICKYYKIYKRGKSFTLEGSNGDYVPARLKYKLCASLINKQARFLFAEKPDITVKPKGDIGKITPESKNMLTTLNDLINTIFAKNNFEEILIKGAKDCFIGKRVACLINFNEEDGVTITFLPSTQFIYETKTGNPNVITKFVCFIIDVDSRSLVDRRIFKKKFVLEDDGKVYLEEEMYDGASRLIETITERQPIKLDFIPAVVIVNDGLTGDMLGESEIELLSDYEMWYSKLSNADSDAERKSMNPTKYVVDMESNSTKNLSTAAGALWDLGTDQNLETPHPLVGLLEPQMNYSHALKVSLDRIKTAGYEQVDMPNITLDALQGSITSGKSLKAIYWPLIVRCKEKMKTWGPRLATMADIIIKGSMVYPKCVLQYTTDSVQPVDYEISVEQNTPLPEDEIEEKTTDLAEVESAVMSKKSYMKKWRMLTDDQVEEELNQIAYERQVLEDSSFNNGMNGDNSLINPGTDDFNMMGVNSIKKDGTQNGGGEEQEEEQDSADSMQEQFGGLSQLAPSVEEDIKELNGSQISSLIHILNNYRAGSFSRSQAITLIRSMGLSESFAVALLEEEDKKGVM